MLRLILGALVALSSANTDVIQEDPSCPAGFTGTNCQNVVCSSPTTPMFHDGTANYGDTIAIFSSMTCDDTFIFPIDVSVLASGHFIVEVDTTTAGMYPGIEVTGPDASSVAICSTNVLSDRSTMFQVCIPNLAGLYSVKLIVQQAGSCAVTVAAKTAISVDGGFVLSKSDDNVQEFTPADNQAISRYPIEGTSAYLAFAIFKETFPASVSDVRIFANFMPTQVFDIDTRYNCGFPHVTRQTFNCTSLQFYHIEFEGVDSSGNVWQRTYYFTCDAPAPGSTVAPTGTYPTHAPPETCNQGVLSNGMCYCGEYFEGEECEWPVCFNGGTLNIATGQCLCANGWTGNHCQHVQCKTRSDDDFNNNDRALGFVIRTTQSMAAQIDQIKQATLNLTTSSPRKYKSYFLSMVYNGAVLMKEYSNAATFLAGIQAITTPPTDKICSDPLFDGILQIVNSATFQKYKNSIIFVFSDGVADDELSTIGALYQQLAYFRTQVFFVLSDSAAGSCNVDITTQGYDTLIGFGGFSQGLTIKADLNYLAETIVRLEGTLNNPVTITQTDLLDCTLQPVYQPFFVDELLTNSILYISATGTNLQLTLTRPDLTTSSPTPTFQKGNFYLWIIIKPMMGAYMLSLGNGGGECSHRVYTSYEYQPYFGATTDLLTDLASREPVYGQESHLVARLNHLDFDRDPMELSAEITVWFNDLNSYRTVVYSSSGLYRDGCGYDIYFGPWNCPIVSMGFYATIYVTDPNGQTVQRTTTGFCSGAIPPDPSAQCQNGGASANGTCICPSHFTGNKCQNIICENLGTPVYNGCRCPSGYTGTFCEITQCTTPNPAIRTSPDFKSLTFLMHDSLTTRSVIRSVDQIASRVINEIAQQHQNWFSTYQLYRFNDTASVQLSSGPNREQFIRGINQLYQSNQQNSDYSCNNLDLYKTIYDALGDSGVQWGGIFYIFVYGIARPDLDSYDKIITHIEDNKVQINVVQFSMMPCGQDYTSDGLMSLVAASGGTYFLASGPNAGNVVKQILTGYESGLVYERYAANCSDVTFYIPVDANTQSFTAYIQGEMLQDPIYIQPPGYSNDTFYVNNIWNDIGSDSRMDQIISGCDEGWNAYDGRCWMFLPFADNWEQANQQCRENGGTLATIYNQGDQDKLNFQGYGATYWIGLNDLQRVGQYVWQPSGGPPLTLNQTGYTNWASGQPVNDEQHRCVAVTPSGWAVLDCSESHFISCYKPMYNSEFEPRHIGDDLIPRGIWGVRVQADGGCSVHLRAQSSLQVLVAYSTNVHSDYGTVEPIQQSGNNHVIAHVNGLTSATTYSLEYAHMYSNDGQLLLVQNMNYRDSCSFNYISTAFTCPRNQSSFQMMLSGVDNYGLLYQRVVPVICMGGAAPDSCENGGEYFEGFCWCPPNYYGESCELIMCFNGGFPSGDLNQCECPREFTGQFCEMPVCTRDIHGNFPDVSINGRTFVLALDGSSTGNMASILTSINTILTNVLKNVQTTSSHWFSNYVGIVFRDSGVTGDMPVVSNIIQNNDSAAWITAITNELTSNPYKSKQTSRAIFQALRNVLSVSTVKDNSYAFVITSSSVEDVTLEDQLLSTVSNTHATINVIVPGDSTAPGGGQDYSNISVVALFESAHDTGGNVYQITDGQDITDPWSKLLSSLYGNNVIISHHVDNCTAYSDYVQMGSNGSQVIVDVFASVQAEAIVLDPSGTSSQGISLISSKKNFLTSFTATGGLPGIYTVNLDTKGINSGICMFNVRTISAAEVYVSFTQDTLTDNGLHDGSAVPFPQGNLMQNAIAVATSPDNTLTHVQLFDIEARTLFWASPLIMRSSCAYPYISELTFLCEQPTFLLGVEGMDYVGHPFRRLFTYHCQGFVPPPPPPPPSTTAGTTTMATTTSAYPTVDPTQTNVDLILIYDSSASVDWEEYTDEVVAFQDVYTAFTFNNSRIVLASYDNDVHFDGNDFNSINDLVSYNTRIAEMINLGETGNPGNNIASIFTYITTTLQASTPFRANARKVLLFISTVGWDRVTGFQDPAASVAAARALGLEIIAVALGDQSNVAELQAISNCTISVASVNGLQSVDQYLKWNIAQPSPLC